MSAPGLPSPLTSVMGAGRATGKYCSYVLTPLVATARRLDTEERLFLEQGFENDSAHRRQI